MCHAASVPSWRLLLLRLRAGGRLHAGPGVRVGREVRIRVAGAGRVELDAGAVLADGARIDAPGGTVRIGRGARLEERAVISAHAAVELAPDAVVGPWALVTDAGPTWEDPERPVRLQPQRAAPARLGQGARIGPHAVVGAGVTVAAGAVVAPYAVCERDVPAR